MYTTGERLEMYENEIAELRKDLEEANEVIRKGDELIALYIKSIAAKNVEIARLKNELNEAIRLLNKKE